MKCCKIVVSSNASTYNINRNFLEFPPQCYRIHLDHQYITQPTCRNTFNKRQPDTKAMMRIKSLKTHMNLTICHCASQRASQVSEFD